MGHTNKYWICIIGSTDHDNIPDGGDRPMRKTVQGAYINLIGEIAENCWSGWGLTEERKELLMKVWNMHSDNVPTKNEIEASKDMYEALQILAGEVDKSPKPYTGKEKLEIAKQALKKAKGEDNGRT